jgi:hypothetical protein
MKIGRFEFYNLTPHAITLLDDDNNVVAVIPPEPEPARLSQETEHLEYPLSVTLYGEPTGVPPEPEEGVFYIVSQLIFNAIDREDLVVPAEVVRDAKGNIIGCKSFGVKDVYYYDYGYDEDEEDYDYDYDEE